MIKLSVPFHAKGVSNTKLFTPTDGVWEAAALTMTIPDSHEVVVAKLAVGEFFIFTTTLLSTLAGLAVTKFSFIALICAFASKPKAVSSAAV
ncbi:hypothetical protein D9M72_389790 [compost metagenome]